MVLITQFKAISNQKSTKSARKNKNKQERAVFRLSQSLKHHENEQCFANNLENLFNRTDRYIPSITFYLLFILITYDLPFG